MKLESVQAFPIRIRAKEDLRGGTFGYTHYQTVLVRAEADGVEGWGEAMTRSDPFATALLVRHLSKDMVGKRFSSPSAAWERAWRGLRVRGHTRGVDVEALSGIEIALQDCAAKIAGKPLASLFSRSPATEVPVFAGSLFESRGPMEGQVDSAKARGLLGAKVKVGFGVEKDRALVSRVRELWPEGMLVADANGAYDASTAKKVCRALSAFDLAWFEEPVLSDDLDGYARLKGAGVTIGAGETWFPGDFDIPLREKLVGVVEPSVSRCGGIGVTMDVASRATRRGMKFSPMTGMNSAISLAASLHAAAARRSIGVEYNPFPNPLQSELALGIESPRGGRVRVPSGNGLGVDVDLRFVRANAS